ncbi:hypothetical protein QWM81_14495 [Streptomyces ficellus]|uniref:Uncharacterized protein n=1 Tax=Streptomyces ficellus TaxID=1977088 RepID=A0ABT7Z735_9ACTN|nr:hypothetical protein [Streptomyces ficellus]MDN3295246.1 hypothetical protein [Streptomyces ficellus]
MDDKRLQGEGHEGAGIPRDLPDEQAGNRPDHWDPDLSEAAEGDLPDGTPAEDTPEDGDAAEPSG